MDAGETDLKVESLREIDRRVITALVRAQEHLGLPHRVQMATLMGVEASTYNRWVDGNRRIPAWALVRAAEISGLTTAQLLEETETGEKPRPEYQARLARVEKQMDDLIGFVNAELERRRRQHHSSSTEQVAGS